MSKIANPMKVITGPDTRWSYANVWEPKSINGGAPKYSVSLIIPKSDNKTLAKIKAAIEAAYKEGEAKLKGNGKSVPALSAIKTPLRDGDTERPDDPAYANAYFINANASSAPGIVDVDRNPILTRSEVYSGVYGRASITFYAFNSSGNRGIACGLNNLQKVRDGEPLGGKARVARKSGSTGWHQRLRRSGLIWRAWVRRSSLALTRLTKFRRVLGVCSPRPTCTWMPQEGSACAPAARRARTQACTVSMSSQRQIGLTNSVPWSRGPAMLASLTSFHRRPSGAVTSQAS